MIQNNQSSDSDQPEPPPNALEQNPLSGTPYLPPPNTYPALPSPEPVSPVSSTINNPTASETKPVPSTTLEIFKDTLIPINDPIDLAERLLNLPNIPAALDFPVKVYQNGDQESFWVSDTDTNKSFRVQAVLVYSTDHVYFWVEEGVQYRERDIQRLIDQFEEKIYPTTRAFFGSEWSPGVDADPHLYMLYAKSLGGPVAGYFSSADEFLPLVRKYSNGHEMFLLSAQHIDLDDEYAYSVLAHEFQHMIQWYRDRNEETWLNEGMSSLASFMNGYSIGGHDRVFGRNPDVQLNNWPAGNGNNAENYGASFLFTAYFLDRFGKDALQSLISHPENGLDSLDQVLADRNSIDPKTKKPVDADDFFLDWQITNYLQDKNLLDGRYSYHSYSDAPQFAATQEINRCPADLGTLEVHQYGVNSINIRCRGNYVIKFKGSEWVPVLPVDPYSGQYAFFSNRGDESDMSLTQEFDFSESIGPLTFTYWTWYDLEEDFDYVYLEASTNGKDWIILSTPSGTPEDPSGNSYGWGYNGKSGGGPHWINQSVDISQFAGEKVAFRFEYVTDSAVNGEGFWLDDVSIPEVGYFSDFETDAGGWVAEGFVRIQNRLPQTFGLAIIQRGRNPSVQIYTPMIGEELLLPVEIGTSNRDILLILSGTARYTHQKAKYTLEITSQ